MTAGARGLGRRAVRAAPVLAVVLVVAVAFLPRSAPYDLQVFLRAGHRLAGGGDVYPAPGSRSVYSGFSFVYPFVMAWPFAALAWLPDPVAVGICTAVGFAAVLGACTLAGPGGRLPPVLLLLSSFTLVGLQLGSMSVLLLFGLVAAWRLRDRPLWFALVATPLVASKLFLAPLLLWLLLTGRWRALGGTVAGLIGVLGLGFLTGPLGPVAYARLLGALARHEAASGLGFISLLRGLGVSPTASELLAVALAGAVVWWATLRMRRTGDERWLYSAAVVAALLLTPVLWSHYLVLLAAPLLVAEAGPLWFAGFAVSSWAVTVPHGSNAMTDVLGLVLLLPIAGYAAREQVARFWRGAVLAAGLAIAGIAVGLTVLTGPVSWHPASTALAVVISLAVLRANPGLDRVRFSGQRRGEVLHPGGGDQHVVLDPDADPA
ncbi:MAG TPA: glycosyltransferase family 87 protein [Mycobacteriales bacterium]|nr:glycosyltransferase family 87 protein [Mycobacteriales bacterium]